MENLLTRREREILERLEAAGFEGYFVGGCIRDALIAAKCEHETETVPLTAGDIDVATNATPKQVQAIFSSYPVILTGLKHGTVTVLLPAQQVKQAEAQAVEREEAQQAGLDEARVAEQEATPMTDVAETQAAGLDEAQAAEPAEAQAAELGAAVSDSPISVEVTTYRSDGSYSDNRHPDHVKFLTSIEEDLARRDFTMNAIACDVRGNLVDPFGGEADINAKCIRAVGDPGRRFQEDALRIMRALRFAAVLGFAIEEETEATLFQKRHLLQEIAAERIFTELKKLVTGKNAGNVIRRYVDVLGVVIPELLPMKGFNQHNPYHKYDVLEHCVRAMETVRTERENAGYMKLAALLHDIGKPDVYSMDENGIGHFYGHPKRSEELVRIILSRLKSDKRTMERVAVLVKHHDLLFEKDERLLKKWMNRLTSEVLFEILEIKLADNFATGNMSEMLADKFHEIRRMMEEILEQEQCFSRKNLAVKGGDLIAAGVEQGSAVGKALDELLEAVIEGSCDNEREALLRHLQKIMV